MNNQYRRARLELNDQSSENGSIQTCTSVNNRTRFLSGQSTARKIQNFRIRKYRQKRFQDQKSSLRTSVRSEKIENAKRVKIKRLKIIKIRIGISICLTGVFLAGGFWINQNDQLNDGKVCADIEKDQIVRINDYKPLLEHLDSSGYSFYLSDYLNDRLLIRQVKASEDLMVLAVNRSQEYQKTQMILRNRLQMAASHQKSIHFPWNVKLSVNLKRSENNLSNRFYERQEREVSSQIRRIEKILLQKEQSHLNLFHALESEMNIWMNTEYEKNNSPQRFLQSSDMIQNIEFDFLDQMDQKSEITPGEDRSDSKNISEEMIEEFDQSSLVYGAVSSDQYHSLFEKACPAVYETIDGLEDFLYSSQSLMMPADGYISAGTWAYPQGGLHLGMDLALPLMSELRAPADGVILYASAPVASNNGYLGNTSGYPMGGGNTICMLASTEDGVFAISLCHLSNRLTVAAGSWVRQGELLAYSGNSGNSSGPHTHIEVFRIKGTLQEAADYFVNHQADFSFGCGWSDAATCSQIACRIRPESVF